MGSLDWEELARSQRLDHICSILSPKWLNSNSRTRRLTESPGG